MGKKELEDALKQIRKLRKLLRQYIKIREKLGVPDNLDEAIQRIRKMHDDVEYVIQKREEWRKLLGYND